MLSNSIIERLFKDFDYFHKTYFSKMKKIELEHLVLASIFTMNADFDAVDNYLDDVLKIIKENPIFETIIVIGIITCIVSFLLFFYCWRI